MQQPWIFQAGSRKRGAGFVTASDLREADVQQFLAAMKGRRGPVAI
jgi:hypothetical protein